MRDGPEIVLASTSPRRRELLGGLGIGFRVVPPCVEEDLLPGEPPRDTVERLALSKALSVARPLKRGLVVGADSVVVLKGRILGKPADAAQGKQMLRSLRGEEHQVVTGVDVVDAGGLRPRTASQVSVVYMRDYSDEEIGAYVASGEPLDKAGAYAVQDASFSPAARVDGCYANVIGLPLCLLIELLNERGYHLDPGSPVKVPDGCSECPLRDGQRDL